MNDIYDEIRHDYNILRDYVDSEQVNVYVITSIMVKNYGKTQYSYQVVKCLVCFVVQMFLPVLVIYDIISKMVKEPVYTWCSDTGSWVDRTSSTIMCSFLLIFYIRRWISFLSQFNRKEGNVSIMLLESLELYVSEIFFVCGFIANMMTHCLNTLAGLIILYQTIGTLDIVVNSCALYYLNDISNIFVSERLKVVCLNLLKEKYSTLEGNINQSIEELNHENISYRKWIDTSIGTCAFIFMATIFPILGISILLALIGGVVYLPICHP